MGFARRRGKKGGKRGKALRVRDHLTAQLQDQCKRIIHMPL